MTITLKPTTEALLREKAQQDGQDLDTLVDMLFAGSLEAQAREDEETGVAVSKAMAAVEAGREKPMAQYLAEQRAKRGLPDFWPSARLSETKTGVVVAK
jgi:hypothetical protein